MDDEGVRSPSPKRAKLDPQFDAIDAIDATAATDRDAYRPYRLRRTLDGWHAKGVSCAKVSPGGTWLATASADATARIVPLGAAMEGEDCAPLVLTGHTKGISDLCWSHDSALVATASDDRTVRVWRARDGKARRVFRGHTNFVTCCTFNRSGSLLATGSFDETVRVWDVRQGSCLRTLPAHSDPVTAVDFCPDGTMLLTAAHDGLVRIWDTQSGQCLKTFADAESTAVPIGWAGFSPNGRYYLSCTLDSTVRVWDYVAAVPKKTYTGHVNVKFSSRPALSNAQVVIGGDDGAVTVYDAQQKHVLQRLDPPMHKSAAVCVDRSMHGQERVLVVAYTDGSVRIFV